MTSSCPTRTQIDMSYASHVPCTFTLFTEVLDAQHTIIWPHEEQIFRKYFSATTTSSISEESLNILDVGCGTGGTMIRLAQLFPNAKISGVDLCMKNVLSNRERFKDYPNLHFEQANAYELSCFQENSFDLVVNRHMLQELKEPHLVLQQMHRVTKPGGFIHILGEDYGMFQTSPDYKIAWEFSEMWIKFYDILGDALVGRKLYGIMKTLKLAQLNLDYITLDSCNSGLVTMLDYWKKTLQPALASESKKSDEHVEELFLKMFDCIRNDYCCWQIPVLSAQK